MNKLSMVSIFVVLALLVGCQPAQEGTAKDVSYVPIDQIVVEQPADTSDGAVIEETPDETVVEETPAVIEETTETTDEQVAEEQQVEAPTTTTAPKEIVVIVQETDLVKLKPVAADPDKDQLAFTYTTPLNGVGEWQTTYGDAGQYTVTITASDEELTASKDALVIVNKKEEAPTIDLAQPEQIQQKMNENTDLMFSVKASDLNKDALSYSWKLDGGEVSSTDSYTYRADFNGAGSHTIKVEITDGTSTTSLLWAVTVANVDRAPILAPIPDITVRETETVKIVPQATDPDGDSLDFSISDPVGDGGVWSTTYDDAGVYTVRVAVSDGELEDSQDVKVTVINVNRPPVIEDIIQVK